MSKKVERALREQREEIVLTLEDWWRTVSDEHALEPTDEQFLLGLRYGSQHTLLEVAQNLRDWDDLENMS